MSGFLVSPPPPLSSRRPKAKPYHQRAAATARGNSKANMDRESGNWINLQL